MTDIDGKCRNVFLFFFNVFISLCWTIPEHMPFPIPSITPILSLLMQTVSCCLFGRPLITPTVYLYLFLFLLAFSSIYSMVMSSAKVLIAVFCTTLRRYSWVYVVAISDFPVDPYFQIQLEAICYWWWKLEMYI